ncbi:MAG: hypothetical protein AAF602_03120 [Myxococcota bacterium]
MRNVMAGIALSAMASCAQTPCEEAQDLELACDPAIADAGSIDGDLPQCEDDSIDACVANCALSNDETFCEIRARTAEASVIQAYTDCLDACATPKPMDEG